MNKLNQTLRNMNLAAMKHLTLFERVSIPLAFVAAFTFFLPGLVAFAAGVAVAWFAWGLFNRRNVFTATLAALAGLVAYRLAHVFIDGGVGMLYGIAAVGMASFLYRAIKSRQVVEGELMDEEEEERANA